MTGRYTFSDGKLIADDGMLVINGRIARLKVLADIGDGVPSFYVDPSDGTYWECREFEDYRKELRRVDRGYIEHYFPTVDPDRPL